MTPTVLVVPLSGYINRLQSIASAAELADLLGAEWKVVWQTSSVASARADQLFQTEFCDSHFISTTEVVEKWGVSIDTFPMYLTADHDEGIISLRGHDKGEQYFMKDLRNLLAVTPQLRVLIIVAGGKFDLHSGERSKMAVERRQRFYRWLPFAPEIKSRAKYFSATHGNYLGLHLRYTDRSLSAPSPAQIKKSVKCLTREMGITDYFVTADSVTDRDKWVDWLGKRGLKAWTTEARTLDRSSDNAGIDALVDWLVLSHAQSSVYFRESSFGEEAAVASGAFSTSYGLTASRTRLIRNRFVQLANASVTYPKRHWSTRK